MSYDLTNQMANALNAQNQLLYGLRQSQIGQSQVCLAARMPAATVIARMDVPPAHMNPKLLLVMKG